MAAQVEVTLGPVPVDYGVLSSGKEVIVRYSTDIKSGDAFYTDSNGREMQERRLNYRPTWELEQTEPVAGNYYPVNAAAAIRTAGVDGSGGGAQLTVLTDRSVGAASLREGEIEFMVNQRDRECVSCARPRRMPLDCRVGMSNPGFG